jgi:hypothetical protein
MWRHDYQVNARKSLKRAKISVDRLREYFGPCRALAITTDRINEYIGERQAAKAANATIRNELAALRRMNGGSDWVSLPMICLSSPERDHDRRPAVPATRSAGEQDVMKSETPELRGLAEVRTLAPGPGMVSALISAPESS